MKKSYIIPEIDYVDMATEGYHEDTISVSGGEAADTNGGSDIINNEGALLSKDRNVDFSDEESIW